VFALLLLVATTAVYQPAWRGGLLWDDRAHITKPELQSLDGLRRIWFELGATQQYYPLTHSVFWLEHKLWGNAPLGYHLVNIFLHAACAVLLMKVLRRLGVPGAVMAAAIFALHPVQVESVAWMTELKNTLSGVFYFAAAWAYLRYDQAKGESATDARETGEPLAAKEPRSPVAAAVRSLPTPVGSSRAGFNMRALTYGLALGLFILGLLSKTVIATLPAALLVARWWKRGALSFRRDVLPLIPFLVPAIAAGILTAVVERRYIGAQGQEFDFTIVERFLIAGRVVWFYVGKLLWPAKLIFIYPRWDVSAGVWWQYIFPVALLACLGVAWAWRGLSRGPLAALLIFVGTLGPVLGFVNVYPFRFSFVADHFQYLASASVIALLAAGAAGLFAGRDRSPVAKGIGVGLSLVLLGILACLSWSQSRMYAGGGTLYQTTIARNPACWMAYSNLGYAEFRAGRFPQAIVHYNQALRLKPDLAEAHNNLGAVLVEVGRLKEAQEHLRAALRMEPTNAEACFNLGVALEREGKMDEALEQYGLALRWKPDYVAARNNRGIALVKYGRLADAILDLQAVLQFDAGAKARYNLGVVLARAGRADEAIEQFQQTLRLIPDFAEARADLAGFMVAAGKDSLAIERYREELRKRPALAQVHYNLALALASKGRLAEAVEHLAQALRLAQAEGQGDLARDIQTQLDRVRSPRP
jgi:tetratricopeptide (TPR) repeat protein